jgi:peptide/nickel transport system substrate-binding protein
MLKKVRIWYWISSAFVKKYALGLTIGTITGILLVIYWSPITKIIPLAQNYHIGRIGTVTLTQIPLDIQQQVSRGLTKINQRGEWVPDVAQSVEPNEDGTLYTVILKDDVFWPDGSKLTSADIDLTITDVAIQKPDPQTITFTLKEPFAPFPSILSQPILKKTMQGVIRKKTIITGLNQYAITNVETNGQYLKKVTLNSNTSTRIYHFFPTEDDAIIAFKLGRIDTIQDLTSTQLNQWPKVETQKANASNRYLALFFNTSNKMLQDKSLRQLLAYATPKQTDDTRVISPISRQSWAYNPQVKPYIQNIDTAKASLDKIKSANPEMNLELTLTTTPAYVEDAQKIIEAWKQLDITVQLQIVPMPDTNDYQVLLIGQQIPDDPDQYLLWHSTQATNISKYQSPKIDKLLEDGRKEINKEERKQIYQDFQRFLVEDCPVVFLHQLENYSVSRNGIY